MDSHNAIRAAQRHMGLLPRSGDVTISPHYALTEEEYAIACLQFEAKVDSDREILEEAKQIYSSESAAMSKALDELDLALAVHALALSPSAVGGRFSHQQANDHSRLAHFHLSAAIALDKDRRGLIEDTTPDSVWVGPLPWYYGVLGTLGAVSKRALIGAIVVIAALVSVGGTHTW